MFNKNNLTTIEKLLFAQNHIKKLEVEKGQLIAEVDELKYLLNEKQPRNKKLLLETANKRHKKLYETANAELIFIKNKQS